MAAGRGTFTLGPLVMDLSSYLVTVDGRPVPVPRADAELLKLLLRERGRCVPRRQMAVAMSALGAPAETLDDRIRALRIVLTGVEIVAVGGVGYRIGVSG